MKKILSIILLIVSINGFSQGFPATQSLGTVNTKVVSNGGFEAKKGLINGVYVDTTAANAGYIDFYTGAQIYCTSDQYFYLRDTLPMRWTKMAKFSDITVGGIYAESVVKSNDSVFLNGEKIYAPGANKVYGGDNAGNMGFHDAAIINTTNAENGDFQNYRNGEWVNTKYFREMKFRTADIGYMAIGDSILTDTAFVYAKLNVFREGELQYDGDTTYGYEQNVTTGKLTFHPPAAANERWIIQVYDTLQWQSVTHQLVETCVDFNVSGDLTESPTCTWSSAAGTGKGYSTTSLSSGTAGTFTIQNTGGSATDQNPIGLDNDASNTEDYINWECTVYRNSSLGIYSVFDNSTTPINTSVTASAGDWVRFNVSSGGVIKAQYSTNSGGSWTDIYTYSLTGNHTLYAKTHLVVAGRKIIQAKVFAFQ